MIFKIVYILFFIASYLYGSLQLVGPVTPRHIMTVAMLAMCFREGMPKLDKYMILFIIFTSCVLCSGIAYPQYMPDTLKWVVAAHFVAIVAFQATRILVEKYNAANCLLYTFIAIGILDAIVTIGQFQIGPYAEVIMKVVANNVDTDQLDMSEYHGGDSMAGFVPPGLVGAVANGYLLSALTILVLYNKRVKLGLLNIVLWLFCLYALYCLQEKTALVAGGVLSMFLLYKIGLSTAKDNIYLKLLMNVAVIAVVIAVVIAFILMSADNEEMRYNDGFEMTDARNDLLASALTFISENPFGGIFEFNKQNHDLPPHNLFLNAFVWGGYLGGICILLLLFWQGMLIAQRLLRPVTGQNIKGYVAALTYLCFTLNSITHNSSIVMGDFFFWAFWAVFQFQKDEPVPEDSPRTGLLPKMLSLLSTGKKTQEKDLLSKEHTV